MPIILPISDLRNYTDVLNRVDVDRPVYLTRNGRGTYVITKIDDYDRETAVNDLLDEIKQGELSAATEKTVSIEDIAAKFNIRL